jgi:1,4-alpha-glucan branching enzyme
VTAQQHDRLKEMSEATGSLEPADVVEEAKNPSSVLHSLFEWNDAKAAERDRLNTARMLIRRVRIIVHTTVYTVKTPYYVRDPDLPSKQAGYRTTASLVSDKDRARAVLRRELEQAQALFDRSRRVAAALGLESEFEQLLEQVTSLQIKISNAA